MPRSLSSLLKQRWRAIAWALTLLVPVLDLGVGEVLTVTGNAALAGSLPGNAALVARYSLPRANAEDMETACTDLARRALRETVVVQPALSCLAFAADTKRPDPGLAVLVDGLGWRDEFTQRALYNLALRTRDLGEAMIHADALLRQGQDQEALSRAIIIGSRDPELLPSMRRLFSSQDRWSASWLKRHGAELPDDALLEFAAAQAKSPSGLPRSALVELLTKLLSQSRFAAARSLWAQGGAPNFTGEQAWPDGDSLIFATPFDWKNSADLEYQTNQSRMLVANRITPNATASRLSLLVPGTYAVRVSGAPARHGGWRWDVGCGSEPTPGQRTFAADSQFVVPPGCPLQWISVSAVSPEAVTDALPPLQVVPLP